MSDKNVIIVGSGIVGAVIAHELKENGKRVRVIERRNHMGGNLYDFTDKYGIHVHFYGPHIFHTKKKEIWDYISKYCAWEEFDLVCGSVIEGKCVKTSFDFSSVDMFFPEEAETIKKRIKLSFPDKDKASVLEMLSCSDPYVYKFASFLYEKDYKLYTAKQWGISPDKVDKSIFGRVPILFSYGSKYFDDSFQALPVNGYTELIENLLDGIDVVTGVDALDHITIDGNCIFYDGDPNNIVVYTGPLDELFQCRYGKLPYRSLKFVWKHENIESFQEMPVVAYPQAEGYTRITEYKKLPVQNVSGTTYAIEYPLTYREGEDNEPYYPVLTEESQELYNKYRKLALQTKGLYCCGRLGDFKYYNMDQAIENALEISKMIMNEEENYE